MSHEILTSSPEETEAFGGRLASVLRTGSVVALYGNLATGKTCLVRGMAAAYSGESHTHSPTFTLVNVYGERPALYHLDLYRLGDPEELLDLGYEELFEPEGLCVVEWAERAADLLPPETLKIELSHAGHDQRRLIIHPTQALEPGWEGIL